MFSFAACNRADSPKPKPEQEQESFDRAAKDLPPQPRSPVEFNLGGYPARIDLPGQWLTPPAKQDRRVTWEFGQEDLPSITASIGDGPITDWGTRAIGSQRQIGAIFPVLLRADKLADGTSVWLEKAEDGSYFMFEMCRPVPMGALCCSVTEHDWDKKALDAYDALVVWSEQVCRTLRLKS